MNYSDEIPRLPLYVRGALKSVSNTLFLAALVIAVAFAAYCSGWLNADVFVTVLAGALCFALGGVLGGSLYVAGALLVDARRAWRADQ